MRLSNPKAQRYTLPVWVRAASSDFRTMRTDSVCPHRPGAGGGSRTHTGLAAQWILSPLRLPVPPPRQMRSYYKRPEWAGKVAPPGRVADLSKRFRYWARSGLRTLGLASIVATLATARRGSASTARLAHVNA